MKTIFIALLICLQSTILISQTVSEDKTPSLVKKSNMYVGATTNFGAGFAFPEKRLIGGGFILPNIGYFVMDNLSLEISPLGMSSDFSGQSPHRVRFTGELNANYFFYAKNSVLFYAQGGFAYANVYHRTSTSAIPNNLTYLKLGGGVSWRFKNNPCMGVNLELAHYINSVSPKYLFKLPTASIGFNYIFGKNVQH